jgi:hypothetical protein
MKERTNSFNFGVEEKLRVVKRGMRYLLCNTTTKAFDYSKDFFSKFSCMLFCRSEYVLFS